MSLHCSTTPSAFADEPITSPEDSAVRTGIPGGIVSVHPEPLVALLSAFTEGFAGLPMSPHLYYKSILIKQYSTINNKCKRKSTYNTINAIQIPNTHSKVSGKGNISSAYLLEMTC